MGNNDEPNGDSPRTSSQEIPVSNSISETRKRKLDEDKIYAKEIVSHYVKLDPVSEISANAFPSLTDREMKELEEVLEIGQGKNIWPDDWVGNLGYVDSLMVGNPRVRGAAKQSFKQNLFEWARNDKTNAKYIWFVICVVCNMPSIPTSAKKVLAGVDLRSTESMEKAIRRVSYDPDVLREDGWTTTKSKEPIGATGGPNLIGDLIYWDGSNAVVIAYIHDPDIGDLWKAIWYDDDDDETQSFDLEAEEIVEGRRKWERRNKQKVELNTAARRASRLSVSEDFTVTGVELGIVLAASYSKGARPGVYWPARVMHASETDTSGGQSKRTSAKQKLELVFLAPYWGSDENGYGGYRRKVEGLSENPGAGGFQSKPFFRIETVDAVDEMIKEYPYQAVDGLDIDNLRMSFRFTGLPKHLFARYVASHRLALCLQSYAVRHLRKVVSAADRATAGLFDSHPLAVRAPLFPPYSLNLPFPYILSQLPTLPLTPSECTEDTREPIVNLDAILDKMRPPMCWSEGSGNAQVPSTPVSERVSSGENGELTPWRLSVPNQSNISSDSMSIELLVDNLHSLKLSIDNRSQSPGFAGAVCELECLLSLVIENRSRLVQQPDDRQKLLSQCIRAWAVLKQRGEDALLAMVTEYSTKATHEWRRATERLYRYITSTFELKGYGNSLSLVLTDLRCNGHLTSKECFERAVRLPAAIKGAKLAGAGTADSCKLVSVVEDTYLSYAENNLLRKVHSSGYLKRMRSRCASVALATETVALTDTSDGEGGCDTHGSRGTWTAAVTAVAAAVKATDMVVEGSCVNAFCATRPPGHHAGREIHSMEAVSNGFCVLNAAACAAIHATSPVSEGGLSLSRVCIIDFDVHHGNGTQDILCSTFDPRYFYVSLHAGGAGVNGEPMEDDPNHELHDLASKKGGIYPGRCGDTSPHDGVLNIPLGPKVTAQNVATALLNTVSPAVNKFAPDIIILSAGFDAHKNDPMCLGALDAEAFGTITEVCCQLAKKSCNGRVVSVLEGGYGVPCCRPQKDIFLPPNTATDSVTQLQPRQQPSKLLELASDLPDDMDDQVPLALQRRLEKCHAQGFVECVKEHVQSLMRCNKRA